MTVIFLFVLAFLLGFAMASRPVRRGLHALAVFATFLLRHASLRTAHRLTRQALWDEHFMGGIT